MCRPTNNSARVWSLSPPYQLYNRGKFSGDSSEKWRSRGAARCRLLSVNVLGRRLACMLPWRPGWIVGRTSAVHRGPGTCTPHRRNARKPDLSETKIRVSKTGLRSANGSDVTKRAIIGVNSIVSGRNYDLLTSIIAQLLNKQNQARIRPSLMDIFVNVYGENKLFIC